MPVGLPEFLLASIKTCSFCFATSGFWFSSVEHAYQAAKMVSEATCIQIRDAKSPSQAKRLGKILPIRADWNEVKIGVMRDLLIQKFSWPILKRRLLDTGDELLVEGNTWGDTFWGVYRGKGENILGKLLMEVRDAVASE